ncbi:TPA: dCTP deaminase [Vibrio cholerae]|uniref:Deoxycytidine triphosphate deaminase n=2 Tax=Vibrio TaxID=662 RepID=C9E5Q2_VIBFL|nr:dCTP deaminase [Vibrio cholerae]ACV96583.1 deoxycytidine triphosphate deaminase [Vibrio fluvialis Ind1]AIP92376.1 deoxycytidine triphosphate deaminase [Vibrio fluvialis]EGR0499214.1 dCTP deaminase [Vibrio cholerae]EGR0499485.1 dCTP deaminase [Vibrio cholerae]EGR2479864.1 dCTP deaminase [Vibrio cholerae]
MSILNDLEIRDLAVNEGLISPFMPRLVREAKSSTAWDDGTQIHRDRHKIISYGQSSFGYDAQLAEDVELLTNVHGGVIDPMKPNALHYTKAIIHEKNDGSRYFILPPNGYALGHTVEYFKLPRNITAITIGKSTYARSGILINTTPAEAGWEGQLVVEIANLTPLPAMVYINQGITQFLFFRGEQCETSYGDRGGKYQGQTGVTKSKV